MQHAIPIAGMQHIIHNLNAEAHQHLSHWDTFYRQLKVVEALLRIDERRQRYCWTCVRHTPFVNTAYLFDKFSESLYEARWREVMKFLLEVRPLLNVMRNTWSADKFARGVDAEGLARPDQAAKQKTTR